MTILVTNVATTDTFGTWLIKTNTLATIVSQNVVTVDSTANGSISTGSGYVNGYFGANTLIAYTGISGGSLIAGNTLNLLTNTSFVYSGTGLVNFTANSTTSNVSIVSNAVNIIPTSNTTLGGNNLNINAITTNATSNSFNINSNNTTIIGNTVFKANSAFAVLTINGNTLLANTTNTTIVGNTTFANSVLINGLANVNQLNISGAVTSNIAGNLRIEGNISIGGNLAYAGTTGGDIIPGSNNFYKLGNTTNRWDSVYSNSIYGTTTNTVNLTVTGTVSFANSIIPPSNTTYSLGNTTAYWTALYASNSYSNTVIVSNNIFVPSGVIGTPAIAFTGNTDTGFYRPATATIGIIAGGSQILTVNTTTVSVNAAATVSNTINVTGNATFSNTIAITGNTTLSNTLSVAGVATLSSNVAIADRVLLNSISHQFANSYTFTNSSAAANIDIFSISTYRSHEYTVQLTDSTITPNPYYHVTKISILFDGSTAYLTEYGTLFNTTSLGTFDVIIGGGNIGLQLTPTTANVVAKFIRTSIVP
jgi:hypothetical protein